MDDDREEAKDDEATIEDLVIAWVRSSELDRSADYARSGRRFRNVASGDLDAQWIDAFRAWAKDPTDRDLAQRHVDLEAEIRLRGGAVPAEAIEADIAILTQHVKARYEALRNDPEAFAALEAALRRDFVDFAKRLDDAS